MKPMNQVRKYVAKVAQVGFGLLVVGHASAASVLTAADKTAIGAGFTGLQDSVLDIIGQTWTPGMIILAIMSAPAIVVGAIKRFKKA